MVKRSERIYEPTVITPIYCTGWRIEAPRPEGTVHITLTVDVSTLDAEEVAVQHMAVARLIMPADVALGLEHELGEVMMAFLTEARAGERKKKG